MVKLKSKKNLSYVFIAVAFTTCSLIINSISYDIAVQKVKDDFIVVADKSNDQVKRNLDNWIKRQVEASDTIATNQIIIDSCLDPEDDVKRERAYKYLENLNDIYSSSETVTLVSFEKDNYFVNVEDEKILIKNHAFYVGSKNNGVVGKGGLDRSYIRAIYDGQDYFISEVYKSIYRGHPIFVISKAIKQEGKTIGLVVIAPSMEDFTEMYIDTIKYHEGGYMFFVDNKLQIISHPDKSQILIGSNGDPQIISIARKAAERKTVYDDYFKGQDKIYVASQVVSGEHMKDDWYAISTITYDELYSIAKENNKYILPLFFLGFVLIILVVNLVIRANQKSNYIALLTEQSEDLEERIKERTLRLEKKMKYDSLTGLLNHNAFFNTLENIINDGEHEVFSLLMIDIDHFKRVNDKFGHLIGDEVLIDLAEIIKENIRETDFSSRYGGEEFIVLLMGASLEEAINKAESMRVLVENMTHSEKELHITISVGVTAWSGESSAKFVKSVDDLMYKAKHGGRNRVVSE